MNRIYMMKLFWFVHVILITFEIYLGNDRSVKLDFNNRIFEN